MTIRILFALWALILVTKATAGEWALVGAGNATCTRWSTGNKEQQIEILSWMAGFASAMNLDRASENKPEYRLEYMTYEYLRGEIKTSCSEAKDKNQSMSSILLGVLKKLPIQTQ